MYYVYILHSKKDNRLYIGRTDNLKRRIAEHKRGSVISTKNRLPIELIFYEAFLSNKDSTTREKYLKSGFGRQQLKFLIKDIFDKLRIK
ncbi:GIY-YIG nuclease family protein [Patescibacteria group bacterium]|nr:GIY-YIG nuclease family protein [Patescibacteria group bacterium]